MVPYLSYKPSILQKSMPPQQNKEKTEGMLSLKNLERDYGHFKIKQIKFLPKVCRPEVQQLFRLFIFKRYCVGVWVCVCGYVHPP